MVAILIVLHGLAGESDGSIWMGESDVRSRSDQSYVYRRSNVSPCLLDGDKEETNDDGAPILIHVRWEEKGQERRFREDAIAS
jgi:hypothetical protein